MGLVKAHQTKKNRPDVELSSFEEIVENFGDAEIAKHHAHDQETQKNKVGMFFKFFEFSAHQQRKCASVHFF